MLFRVTERSSYRSYHGIELCKAFFCAIETDIFPDERVIRVNSIVVATRKRLYLTEIFETNFSQASNQRSFFRLFRDRDRLIFQTNFRERILGNNEIYIYILFTTNFTLEQITDIN